MGFKEGYSVDWIEHSVPLGDLEGAERVDDGYDVDGFFIPNQRFPGLLGTSKASTEICRTEDGDWLFTKPVFANYGRAGKASIMAALMYDWLDIPSPDIGIDEDKVIIEHLGQLDNLYEVNDADISSIERAVAGKAVTGDIDIVGNIGMRDEDECCVYDFDEAGGPVGERLEDYIVEFVAHTNDRGYMDIDLESVNREAISMARELDLDDYAAELESLLDENLPESYGFNDLDLDTVYGNVEYIRENGVVQEFECGSTV